MDYKCTHCDKKFANKSNLNRHIKEKHKEQKNRPSVSCVLCDKNFKRQEHLQTHLNTVHFQAEKKKCPFCEFSTAIKSGIKKHISKVHSVENVTDKLKKAFKCDLCSKTFSHLSSVRKHKITAHGVKKLPPTNSTFCSLCKLTINNNGRLNKLMHSHFKNDHDLPLESKTIEFENTYEFQSWKMKFEKETTSHFLLRKKRRNYLRYVCRRSGHFTSVGKGKRHLKLQGSCKINGYCPASMSCFIKENGSVVVDLVDTHIGHNPELVHITLSKVERNDIATKLATKIPRAQILKDIRNSVVNRDLQRLHLTNLKDLTNIERDFNLTDTSVRHSSDFVSVGAWVREFKIQNENGLIYYKPQGESDENHPELLESDFVLLFMTEAQIDIFQKYGGDVVCVDGTHGLNSYKFQLHTVLVLDDTREGMPVTFLFSNRQDETVMKIFFEKIKSKTGKQCSKVFMSDMDEVFYASWSKVMGKSDQQLHCTWHVLKAWRQNIVKKIHNGEKRQSTYKMLQTLSCETDEKSFRIQLEMVCKEWNADNDLKEFGEYFYEYYVRENKFKKWAYCFRVGAGINTNMALENFNRTLKHNYLNGKKIKRLDKTIGSLLELVNNKLFDLMLKNTKGKIVSKLKILRCRHREALKLESTNILTEEDHKWRVLSSKCTDLYLVERVQSKPCEKCPLPCSHCTSCFHQFKCSCIDHGIKYNMCKHIHMVARFIKENKDNLHDTTNNEDTMVIDVPSKDFVCFQQKLLKGVSKDCQSAQVLFEEEKSEFLQQLNDIIRNKVTTPEHLKAIKEQCKPIVPILESLTSSTAFQVIDINKQPGNTKTPHQRFFSTKKTKESKPNLWSTSTEEMAQISAGLILKYKRPN